MKHASITRIAFLLLLAASPAWAVEHPGVLPVDADCSSCHTKKISGKSVHSAMSTSCTVCHVAKIQGDMTTLNLLMPKEQICFACHEKSAELRQHVPVVKTSCMDCHDAHSSDQRMLLRVAEGPAALKRK
ncbi:MAG TPA: cytochrome c3 family protein [Candidatus Sulfotelmatobacter sp.]|nr:cytochrome c3 family protein [Candidatus Sulfotelmatobacter sp.]